MTFVEFLRVRRVLLVYAIILAVCVALTVIMAFSAHGSVTVDSDKHSAAAVQAGTSSFTLRDVLATDFARNHTKIPMSALFFMAAFAATILGTIFGTYLCAERSHTPLAWTKPVSRLRFALAYLSVDVVAMAAAFALLMIATFLVIWGLGIIRFVSFDAKAWMVLLLMSGVALAYYGVVRALTVGFPGRGGAIMGASWPIAYVLLGLAAIPLPAIYHDLLVALNFLNPLAYMTHVDAKGSVSGIVPLSLTARVLCVWLLAVVASTAAIMIYRRAEA